MLEPKELLNLTPEEREIILLRLNWRFFCCKPFTALLLAEKTHQGDIKKREELIIRTIKKVHNNYRLKMELASMKMELDKTLELIFYERGKRKPNKNS